MSSQPALDNEILSQIIALSVDVRATLLVVGVHALRPDVSEFMLVMSHDLSLGPKLSNGHGMTVTASR